MTTVTPTDQPAPFAEQNPYAAPEAETRGFSISSLVLGLVSIVASYTFVVPAIGLVLGVLSLKREPGIADHGHLGHRAERRHARRRGARRPRRTRLRPRDAAVRLLQLNGSARNGPRPRLRDAARSHARPHARPHARHTFRRGSRATAPRCRPRCSSIAPPPHRARPCRIAVTMRSCCSLECSMLRARAAGCVEPRVDPRRGSRRRARRATGCRATSAMARCSSGVGPPVVGFGGRGHRLVPSLTARPRLVGVRERPRSGRSRAAPASSTARNRGSQHDPRARGVPPRRVDGGTGQGSGSATNVPPYRPAAARRGIRRRRARGSPRARCRGSPRSCPASSRSAGSDSPGATTPSRIVCTRPRTVSSSAFASRAEGEQGPGLSTSDGDLAGASRSRGERARRSARRSALSAQRHEVSLMREPQSGVT